MPPPGNDLPADNAGFSLSALDAYAGSPGALPGVSFWPRVGARVIDTLAHYIIGACSGFLFGLILAIVASVLRNPRVLASIHKPKGLTLSLFSLLGAVLLETVCEGLHGSTAGKMILGYVVVQEDGTACRFGSALIRSVAYFVDGLFFGLIGYFSMQKTPQQQRHGDEWRTLSFAAAPYSRLKTFAAPASS